MAQRNRRRTRYGMRPVSGVEIGAVALFAVAVMLAWLVARPAREAKRRHDAFAKLTMDEARAYNAAIPFAPGAVKPARPFHFHGTPAAREQAAQCLATAAIYEAGDDPAAQKAVIQVVLNRVRLSWFPDTVCGVVYQGSALKTGCQFSFTCDGSVARRPEHAGWQQARTEAKQALAGAVFRPVGTATHYHADWMVPYWIGTLDKVARVRGHIFYRPR